MCVYAYLCRTSHPPAPDLLDRSSCMNQHCWSTGLCDTGLRPHIRSHLYRHKQRRHHYDTSPPAVNHGALSYGWRASRPQWTYQKTPCIIRISGQWLILTIAPWNRWLWNGLCSHRKFQQPQRTTHCTVPSHESPSGASVKPWLQGMQEKEPSVLVHTPVGHTPGVWHSSMSERQKKKRIRLEIGYRTK